MTRTSNRDHEIRAALLDWYRESARDLPWRRTRDPYRIWLSEIMLQQTRVETVIPYYTRWLEALPDVEALAAADEDHVLKLWEGLGYYRRARNLHRAAQQVVADGGGLPTDSRGWLSLAGVGRYTAGAIASIAFGEPVPVLDGNVKRVLARLDSVTDSIDDTKVINRLWDRAASLVSAFDPPSEGDSLHDSGDFNQALMELGARICVPRRPRCLACPLRSACRAHAEGLAEALPKRKAKRVVPRKAWASAWIERRGRVLLARRPEGLLGGLWELPTTTVAESEDSAAAVVRLLTDDLALEGEAGEPLGSVDHAFTHLKVTITLHGVGAVRGRARALRHTELRWLAREDLTSVALPVAQGKLVRQALDR